MVALANRQTTLERQLRELSMSLSHTSATPGAVLPHDSTDGATTGNAEVSGIKTPFAKHVCLISIVLSPQ